MAQDCRVSCKNWTLPRDESLNEAIITKRITTSENYEYPVLDDIVDAKRAILLVTETLQSCDIHIEVLPTCCAHTITIITDCQKLEVFLGKSEEYHDTCYGELIDDFEDTRVYRFDVDVSSANQTELNLKFIPKTTSFWIYGMTLAIKPNLKALSTSMFGPSVDFNNVQNILADSKQKLTPSAEKCKEFLQTYVHSRANMDRSNMETVMSMMNGNLLGNKIPESKSSAVSNENCGHCNEMLAIKDDIYSRLANYVDERIAAMENRMAIRLDEFERRQNDKLDKIVDLLSKNRE